MSTSKSLQDTASQQDAEQLALEKEFHSRTQTSFLQRVSVLWSILEPGEFCSKSLNPSSATRWKRNRRRKTSSGFKQSFPPLTHTKSLVPQIRAHNPGQLSKNYFPLTLGFKILLWILLEKQSIKVNCREDIFT